MLYTIMPLDTVYEGTEHIQAPEEITFNGVHMQVQMLSAGRARVIRLLSPEPYHYLIPGYYPGSEIRLMPEGE